MSRDPRTEELEKTVILLQEELERLKSPPFMTGTVLDLGKRTAMVSVDNAGIFEVPYGKGVKDKLERGKRIVINPASKAIVDYSEFDKTTGETVIVEEVFDGRLRVSVKGESRVVFNALKGVKPGEEVLLDRSGVLAVEAFKTTKTKYNLEKVPNAPWTNIGGLESTIDTIKSEVEEPFLHREVFSRYGRGPVKGILLYGPPGCGKTLIAKSMAYSLAKLTGNGDGGHFINVKGPEILDKWVGNSEANIRRIYEAARETAQETQAPVIVFVDEAESVLKTRGTGISSDVYDSIVPQFLAELDGINGNGNVITVLATNREDILDPAVLRDGRVDRRIRVPRPNKEGAEQIFMIYLKDKPVQGGRIFRGDAKNLVPALTERIYDNAQAVYSVVSPREGMLGSFSHKHLVSGAMIKGVVDRACGYAIRREIDSGKKGGITQEDLVQALDEEFEGSLGFAQALVKDDWEDVFGAKGRQYQDFCRQGYLYLERADNSQTKSDGGKTK